MVLAASASSFVALAIFRGLAGERRFARQPALAAGLLTLAGAVALAAWLAIRLLTDGRNAGAVAAVRTSVLSLSALALAFAWRNTGVPELKGLTYVLLAAGAAKILLQDVPDGRPGSLVVAFAVFGLALTLAPRWLRRV